jgi:hypothetical protein
MYAYLYLYVVYNSSSVTNEDQSKREIMPCKRDSTQNKDLRSTVQAVLHCCLQLPVPLSTAGLAMFRGGGKLQNARSLHLCANAGSLLNLVLAVHVMRSRCNHNIASILRANFRRNPNDGQRFRVVRRKL